MVRPRLLLNRLRHRQLHIWLTIWQLLTRLELLSLLLLLQLLAGLGLLLLVVVTLLGGFKLLRRNLGQLRLKLLLTLLGKLNRLL